MSKLISKKCCFLGLFLIIGIFFLTGLVNGINAKPRTNRNIAEIYMDSLVSKKYKKAYESLEKRDLIGKPFLNEVDFIAAFQDCQLVKYTMKPPISLDYEGPLNDSADVYEVSWYYPNGINEKKFLVLSNTNDKIDPISFVKETKIQVSADAVLKINGKRLKPKKPGLYMLEMFDGCIYDLYIESVDGEPAFMQLKSGREYKLELQITRKWKVIESYELL